MIIPNRSACSSAVVVLLVVLLPVASPQAQTPATLDAELHRIFEANAYRAQTFGPADWIDPASYSDVERTEAGNVLAAYDAASGTRTVVADAALLTPKGATAPLSISGYELARDRRHLLVFTNTERVWRQNTAVTTGCSTSMLDPSRSSAAAPRHRR
jgi:dipeptidyl-peptidase-4